MLKRKFGFIAIILMVCLSMALIGPMVAEATNEPTIEVEKVEGKTGDIVTVPVTLSNNPGLVNVLLELKYDFGVRLRKAYQSNDKVALYGCAQECVEMVVRTESFYESLKTLWHTENKPFGFEVQTVRIGAVLQRLNMTRAARITRVNALHLIPIT